jgi:threonine synthase
LDYEVKCVVCGCPSDNLLNYKCACCSQPLGIQLKIKFEVEKIRKGEGTLWRYAKFFPYIKEADIVTLGEGLTPLIKFSENLFFKLEYLNPTGSFKDRGAATLISALHKPIKRLGGFIAEDSSGNAGASVAAYAARAGVKAKIYVPEGVSGAKFNQIRFYGADVVRVKGDRNSVAEEAQKPEKGKVYVGHILHPLFRDGIRSLAYEIAEQFGWRVPDRIYLPVSAGTLLLGTVEGFKHMLNSNTIVSLPKIVACQTRQVSPLYHRFKGLLYKPPKTINSIADALISTSPPLLELMNERLRETGGDTIIVDEAEILSAFKELAKKGFFVEPSSAVAYAAYKKQLYEKEFSTGEKAVIVLTGTGLKANLQFMQ